MSSNVTLTIPSTTNVNAAEGTTFAGYLFSLTPASGAALTQFVPAGTLTATIENVPDGAYNASVSAVEHDQTTVIPGTTVSQSVSFPMTVVVAAPAGLSVSAVPFVAPPAPAA